MSKLFQLDHRLQQDCEFMCELDLCQVLLMKDANYPWFILVPKVSGAVELIDLSGSQQQQMLTESNLISAFLLAHFDIRKLNIAALGNVVKQLHIHHIGRCENDIAWPKPVWNAFPAKPYAEGEINSIRDTLRNFLNERETS